MLQEDGSIAELSTLSPLVHTLSGTTHGDRRFYFPKEMLIKDDLFAEAKEKFSHYIKNKHFYNLREWGLSYSLLFL